MFEGGPFRCFNCNKLLAKKLTGSVYEITFECPRCKTETVVKTKEPIPIAAEAVGKET